MGFLPCRNVLLDFEGGTLSLAQLLMDSGVTKVRRMVPSCRSCVACGMLWLEG